MKGICILGASGSVGETAIRVIKKFPATFSLISFSVNGNIKKAKELIDEFNPQVVCITSDEIDKSILGSRYKNTEIIYGKEGMTTIVELDSVNVVLTAIVGSIGIYPTIVAIKKGKILAIANKETLVTFGTYINSLIKKYKSRVIPVDSEHNALYQLLEGRSVDDIRSLTLTASGGALRDFPVSQLKNVSVEDALSHPTWKMGAKITIDSAGMINKGLEVIEAHFLFNVPYKKIEIVIHPESIIHGMIELKDGAFLAYASHPDMIFPVTHSFFFPERNTELLTENKPWRWQNLHFWRPESERYPALALAFQAGERGGTAPAIFNAANEIAVESFLQKEIGFMEIPEMIDYALQNIPITEPEGLEGFLVADEMARKMILEKIRKGLVRK